MEQLTHDERMAIRGSKELIDLYRETATGQFAAIIEYIQNGLNAQDVESRIITTKKRFQAMRFAFNNPYNKCSSPDVWDPATGTCG